MHDIKSPEEVASIVRTPNFTPRQAGGMIVQGLVCLILKWKILWFIITCFVAEFPKAFRVSACIILKNNTTKLQVES